jgi:hypothetical protein
VLKALILIALLGSDDFRSREMAHRLLKGGMDRWADVVEASESHADPEVAARCRALTDWYLRTLIEAGQLYPRGWTKMPHIAHRPRWLSDEFFSLEFWYRETAEYNHESNISRGATKAMLAYLWMCGVSAREIRLVVEGAARNEISRQVRKQCGWYRGGITDE